jgi:GTP-binding protein
LNQGNPIKQVTFVRSSDHPSRCPGPDLPEFAFIGRSNVGKSSLINMIVGRKNLARISVSPGKTQTINHYLVNGSWYLVDLPGYGYAKVSKKLRSKWAGFTSQYLLERPNLMCLFQLIDSRLEPQAIDLDFTNFLGEEEIPFVIVFTKSDKISANQVSKNVAAYGEAMMKTWQSLPRQFITSAVKHLGKEELIGFIQQTSLLFNSPGTLP